MRHFLQSPAWGLFQSRIGAHLIDTDKDTPLVALLERSHGKTGSFIKRLYLPYGPYIGSAHELTSTLARVEAYAHQNKADYIRIEPTGEGVDESVLVSQGYIKQAKSSQPEYTHIIDLSDRTEEEIIASMNATNRNLWRANMTKDTPLNFVVSYDPAEAKELISMMSETSRRVGAVFHEGSYIQTMLTVLGPDKQAGLLYAIHDGHVVAGCEFVVDHEAKTLYYLHAGSYQEARTLNAGNLLLAKLILYAKEIGMDRIDLFGVSPPEAGQDHPQWGFSRFKRSFGGRDVAYHGTWEKGLGGMKYNVLTSLRKAKKKVASQGKTRK